MDYVSNMTTREQIDKMPLEAIAEIFTKAEENGMIWKVVTVVQDPLSGEYITEAAARDRLQLYMENLPTYQRLFDEWQERENAKIYTIGGPERLLPASALGFFDGASGSRVKPLPARRQTPDSESS